MKERISQNLKRLRVAQGKSQEDVANFLGVTSQAVSRWETGRALPDILFLPELAKFFHVSIDTLFSDGESVVVVDDLIRKYLNSINANESTYGYVYLSELILLYLDNPYITHKEAMDEIAARHSLSYRNVQHCACYALKNTTHGGLREVVRNGVEYVRLRSSDLLNANTSK